MLANETRSPGRNAFQHTNSLAKFPHRQIEARRAEIAANAQQAIDAFHQGQLAPQLAETVIAELRRSLNSEIDA